MSDESNPEFIKIIIRALEHWLAESENLDDARIMKIDPHRRELHEAIATGLQFPQTCALASEIVLQTFYFAERKGHWPEWIGFFEDALRQCPPTEYERQGRLLNRLGELCRFSQRLKEAVAVHKQAEALAQEQGDELALAEARYRLGWDYYETKQYELAETCSRFALETFTRLDTRGDLLANCYWALGSIARQLGNLVMAQEHLSHANELAYTTLQQTHQARILNELAMIIQESKRYDEALVYYDKAAQLLEPTISERDKIIVQINRGLTLYWQEKWLGAEMAWRQAMNSTYLRQSGEKQIQARLAHNLGNVLLKQNNFSEAIEFFDFARQIRLELGDNLGLANTSGGLAEVYAQQGQRDEAISLFEEALQLLTAFPDNALAKRLQSSFETQLKALLN